MPSPERIVVVGAGIVGLAVARRLAEQRPSSEVVVVDKEADVARHQTGHNSGVAHAGLYYVPGSLKARLCRRGIGLLKDYCLERGLPYEEIGKVVVARNAGEVDRLRNIRDRAAANGVPDVRWLSRGELAELEPAVVGEAALLSPSTAIVDFVAVTRAYAADVRAAGGTLRLGFEVSRIARRGDQAAVGTPDGERLIADRLVICAGLHSDRVARLAGDDAEPAIVPFRGEYYRLVPSRRSLVRRLVYPVPDPAYPFLGVHFTPRVDGEVDVGPNAVLALAREGYRRRDLRPRDLAETLAVAGLPPACAPALASRRRRAARVCLEARLRRVGPGVRAVAECRGRGACAGRGAGAGGRPRRVAGRRFPDRPHRPGGDRAQRTLAGRHLGAGNRRAHRRHRPVLTRPPLRCGLKRGQILGLDVLDRAAEHAELVALRVGQHHPADVRALTDIRPGRAERLQPSHLGRLVAVIGAQVQVEPVLDHLVVGHRRQVDGEQPRR